MNPPRDELTVQVREEIQKEISEAAKAHQLKRASNSESISKTKATRLSFNSMKDYRLGAQAFYLRGKADGVREAIELLRSKDANKKCCENTLGTGNFVSHSEWADWLEEATRIGVLKEDE